MISRADMLPLLVEACPDFEPSWREFLAYWSEKQRPLPYYLALADLARHLVTVLARGEQATLRRVFTVVEGLIVEGDQYVNEAAIVGLLESLQNSNIHVGTRPEDFEPFLLPQSRRWWGKLEDFWERGQPLLDD